MFFDSIGGVPVEISADGKRSFYLISLNALTEADMPSELQEYQRKVADLQAYKIKAGLSWSNANRAQFPTEAELLEAAANWIDRLGNRSEYLLWLPDDAQKAATKLSVELQELVNAYPRAIATLMIKNRMACHIVLRASANQGAQVLELEKEFMGSPTGESIPSGSQFKSLTGNVVTTSDFYRPNTGVLNVELTQCSLVAGEPLFLLEKDGSYAMGRRDWTLDLTRQKLTRKSRLGKSQIQQLEDFYGGEGTTEKKPEIPMPSAVDPVAGD